MPDDHYPLMPRRKPEDIDLAAIKTDLEFLIERVSRLPTRKEQALRPLHVMVGSAAVVIAWIEFSGDTAYESVPRASKHKGALVKLNLAEGLFRIWVVGTILWSLYSIFDYFGRCHFYPNEINCRYRSNDYLVYNRGEFSAVFLGWTIGVPIGAFLIGVVALRVGRWIAKGFRPSQP
jgi:hypothetical protein